MAGCKSVCLLGLIMSIFMKPGLTEKSVPEFSGRLANAEKNALSAEGVLEENKFIKSKMEIQERKMEEMEIRYLGIINNMQAKLEYLEKEQIDMKSDFNAKLELQDKKFRNMDNEYKIKFKNQETKYKTMETQYKQMVNVQEEKFKNMEVKYESVLNEINSKLEPQKATTKTMQTSGLDNSKTVNLKENYSESDEYKPNVMHNEFGAPDFNPHLEFNNSVTATGTQNNHAVHKRLLQTTQTDTTQTVAFAASMSRPLDNAAIGHVVDFDHVNLNEGNGYNGSDGIFVCPSGGLYLFSFNIHIDLPNQHAGVEIKVNGRNILYSYTATSATSIKGNAPGTTLVRLNTGDHVWVGVYNVGTHIYSGLLSNFIGVRISE